MKTFETEKHSIPEGATHYFNETSEEHFAWWNDNKQMLLDPENANEWVYANAYDDVSNPIPIPQTKEVEWVNGDECISSTGYKFTFIGLCNYSRFDCILLSDMGVTTFGFVKELSRPETKQQREEREVNELCKIAINLIKKDKEVDSCNVNVDASFAIMTTVRAMINAGYRKEG